MSDRYALPACTSTDRWINPSELTTISFNLTNKKEKPRKNLILLKPLPDVIVNGVKYKRPKGTVYKNVSGTWCLINDDGEDDSEVNEISEAELKANKEWYKLTDKEPTNLFLSFDNEDVIFHKDKIVVGCQTIDKKTIKAILKQLG